MTDHRDDARDDARAERAGEGLAVALARLAQECVAATPEQVGAAVSLAATRLVPGAEQASVSLATRPRSIDTLGAVGELPPLADRAQVEVGEGPCVDAAWEHLVVHLRDCGHPTRWPRFCARATELGVGSMLSLQLGLDEDGADHDGERVGALNLYSCRPRSFGEEAEEVGRLVAAHATLALSAALRVRQLREALESRDVIGQAKGLLMARHGLGADEAFALLVRRARDTNTRLRDVAAGLVAG